MLYTIDQCDNFLYSNLCVLIFTMFVSFIFLSCFFFYFFYFFYFKGRPRPNVTWYLDNTVIDESFEQRPDRVTVNHLSYPNIGRQHVNARFVCIASNTNLMPPNSKVLVIDVNRKLFAPSI